MIDRKQLLDDLKPLLRGVEEDLRARCDEAPQIDQALQEEYKQARSAGRTGAAYEQWRADLITQVGVAWVLSCVFVRFLEDNGLLVSPRIAGRLKDHPAGGGLERARDERDLYFQAHPTDSDRDYLLHVFAELAAMPATAELFGPHNPLNEHPDWLSGDAAQKLIEFFQRIDADGTGEIVHDFTDDAWDSRFLGDLYQDLSEAARKKYALLQTPVFVEEFILERTLEPAIQEFGLKGLKMIDPACGSGHFLLGAFARILDHWRRAEPGAGERELINRALASVHGVDINPYAVAIARFRLLLAAMRECGVTRLKDAPNFPLNLACGDSLLHGSTRSEQQVLGFHELAHHYQSEDIEALRRILRPGQYHAVVANPPYITVKDKALNQAYRDRYSSCHMKYSLAVPFLERIIELTTRGGCSGQITTNSFMKREFGKKLVEEFLPAHDLTHIIDSSGAYIPGHSTPTTILLIRNRAPVQGTVRVLAGLHGEPAEPETPSEGLVWQAIVSQVDSPGTESEFIAVEDMERASFASHPWSLVGGGEAKAISQLEACDTDPLGEYVDRIGFMAIASEDDAYLVDDCTTSRRRLPSRLFLTGEGVRDWSGTANEVIVFPYDDSRDDLPCMNLRSSVSLLRHFWPYRTTLSRRLMFGKIPEEHGLPWHAYMHLSRERLSAERYLVFSNVATHNHFALITEPIVANCHAPVVRKSSEAPEKAELRLLAYLNSSFVCFWIKQVFYPKATTTGDISIEKGRPEANRYEISGTGLEKCPVPRSLWNQEGSTLSRIAEQMVQLVAEIEMAVPANVLSRWKGSESEPLGLLLKKGERRHGNAMSRLVALQEELDWEVYRLIGITDSGAAACVLDNESVGIAADRRPFLWEDDARPAGGNSELQVVYEERRKLTNASSELRALETLVYKRPWWGRQGVYGRLARDYEGWSANAIKGWLLSRLESYFDLDGRMNNDSDVTAHASLRKPCLTSIAQVADIARADSDFMQVAELYRGRADFDIGALVAELIEAESVPHLPILRYKPSGMDKRTAWERTWELQRLEDDIDALFEVERLRAVEPDEAEKALRPAVQALGIEDSKKPAVLAELVSAAKNLANMVAQKLNLDSEDVIKPITDAAKRAKSKAVGDIPVPPKYAGKDFISTGGARYWALRGKLDVPKERWVSFPHCEGEDGSGVIAWAGYDHLQLAQAIAERFENARQHEGRTLVPLLASLGQLIPWLKQWHNDMDPTYGMRLGDFFKGHLETEAKALNMTPAEAMAWTPPAGVKKTRKRKKKTKKTKGDL